LRFSLRCKPCFVERPDLGLSLNPKEYCAIQI
jgi:hypothetical protein